MLVEELEVEPLTYCVKVECDVELEDENSNLVADEYETSDGYNGDTNFDAPITDDESTEDRFKLRPKYEQPGWMNNDEEENDNVTSETVSMFICQYCNSSFATEEKFNRHSLIHTSVSGPKQTSCFYTVCEEIYFKNISHAITGTAFSL